MIRVYRGMAHTLKIDEDVRMILGRSTIIGNRLVLPGQLDRKLYERVDKVLKAAGGKWDRASKSHVFAKSPLATLGLAQETGEITDQKKLLGAFYTPEPLARRLVEMAEIEDYHVVLEPSAGRGAIASVIAETAKDVQCIETDPESAKYLAAQGFRVGCCDFLVWAKERLLRSDPKNAHKFHRIVMNPPFANDQGIDHVTAAFKLLHGDGILVSVVSRGAVSGNVRKKRLAFQRLIARYGFAEDLPDDSFKDSGTGVRTSVVKLVRG